MRKEGISHVDWAVSMGIFLVYVLSMFIMIQPGVQKFYKEDTLISIVEDGFERDLHYNITKMPAYIEVKDLTPGVTDTISTTEFLDFSLPFSGNVDTNDFNVTFRTASKLDLVTKYRTVGASGKISFFPTENLVEGNTYVFWLYYAADMYVVHSATGGTSATDKAKMSSGSMEKLSGIKKSRLTSFSTIDCASLPAYTALKASWNFPAGKEFSIYYVETDTLPYDLNNAKPLCNYGSKTLTPTYDQSDVYVKEWSDWILDPSGQLKPVIVNVRIW